MFFNALNYKLELHSICDSLKKSNLSLSAQDPRTEIFVVTFWMLYV